MKLFLLSLITLAIVSCSKNDSEPSKLLDPNARIRITGESLGTKAVINDSLAFITRYAMGWYATFEPDQHTISRLFDCREFYGRTRDTVNNRLLLQGIDVIDNLSNSRELQLGIFVADLKDIVIIAMMDEKGNYLSPKYGAWVDYRKDTIGYIPNSVVLKARKEITEAFNKKDYDEVYRLFDEAFIFRPTTGAKWRAMKATGME